MTTTADRVAGDLLDRARARLERAEAARVAIGLVRAPFTRANVLGPYNEIGIEVASAASWLPTNHLVWRPRSAGGHTWNSRSARSWKLLMTTGSPGW